METHLFCTRKGWYKYGINPESMIIKQRAHVNYKFKFDSSN